MFRNYLKSFYFIILSFFVLSTISCPNDQMRNLVELKVSDPVADTFIINSGAPTSSRIVTLNSIVSKEEDSLEMRFKNEGYSWSEWEDYAPAKTWTLSFVDGVKKVFAEYRDEGHHVVSMVNTITLNTGAPAGDFYIYGNGLIDNPAEDNQHEYTNKTSVKLCMNISNVQTMRFSNTSVDNNDAAWDAVTPSVPFTDEYDWTLASGDGAKTVWAQFVTNAGTETYSSNSAVDGHLPYLDTTAPAASNVQINGGASNANSISVTLTYDFTETVFDGEHKMWAEYRNDGGSWSAKEAVSPGAITKNWVLRSEIGTRTVYVRLSDLAGNVSSAYSDDIYLDTAAPPPPSPTTATPTNDTTPTWTWGAVAGAVNYRYYFPDYPIIELGNVTSFTPATPLYTNQDHTFYLQSGDASGNWSAEGSHTVTIDTNTPSAPTGLDLSAADDTGSSNSDNITSSTSNLTISGSAEANSEVVIYNNTTPLVTATANSSGNFSGNISLSGDGSKSVRARCTDAAGNQSPYSSILLITIDTSAPSAPSAPNLSTADDTGSSSTDNITKNTSNLTFTGTAEAGSTVTIYESSTSRGSCTATGGNYSADISLSEGSNKNIRARATDAAGNISGYSSSLYVTVDTTVPSAPSTPNLAAADDHGTSNTDNETNQTSGLTFSGTAEAGATVTIYEASTARGTCTATGGNYSDDISLSAGSNKNIRARATDTAGNQSGYSAGLSVTIDTTAPGTPSGVSGEEHATSLRPTWTWNPVSGAARYRCKINSASWTTKSGTSYQSPNNLFSGYYNFYVQAGDTAGNWSSSGEMLTQCYNLRRYYNDSTQIGTKNIGKSTTNMYLGAGQSGISFNVGNVVKTFGVYMGSLGGTTPLIRLQIRDNSGTVKYTYQRQVPSSFTGGWFYWTGIELQYSNYRVIYFYNLYL